MNISLLGPPGAGKGTQASRLRARFGLLHLSTGNLLRENLADRNALGLLARKYMDRGELVPDEVVEAMIEERLLAIPPEQGVLFDGFPRTPEQAAFLDELMQRSGRRLNAAIYLELGEADVLQRLGGRLVCTACQATYHKQALPPTKAGVCDVCGLRIERRPDDNAETTRVRLGVFQRHIGPVLNFYQPGGRLLLADGSGAPVEVEAALVALLTSLQNGEARAATAEEIRRLQPDPKRVARPQVVASTGQLNLVLLGGPGSGKGTQAENLGREFRLSHVASGDLFRENLKQSTRLGQLARGYMNRGELVPDDITEAMVEERLARADIAGGFLLDGFPRTLPQAEALTEMLAKLQRPPSAVLYIHVSDAALVDRLSGRWICRACQRPYHMLFKPPICGGVCDHCGGELYQRDDDKSDTVRARLKTFHKQTEPLIEYYKRVGLLVEVNGEGTVASVSRRTLGAVQTVVDREQIPAKNGVQFIQSSPTTAGVT
ncbi:MAG: adenylate kinase [Opitutaceae bacterium]|nr:adenylate kinase [Verrucomicrobiales bacterium]